MEPGAKELQKIADALGLKLTELSPEQLEGLSRHVEFKKFLKTLKALEGNFVRARWYGIDITPNQIKKGF